MSDLLRLGDAALGLTDLAPPLADHSMGAAALGFAGPPLLVFAGLAALVIRERLRRR
jgi:hypothetical protein